MFFSFQTRALGVPLLHPASVSVAVKGLFWLTRSLLYFQILTKDFHTTEMQCLTIFSSFPELCPHQYLIHFLFLFISQWLKVSILLKCIPWLSLLLFPVVLGLLYSLIFQLLFDNGSGMSSSASGQPDPNLVSTGSIGALLAGGAKTRGQDSAETAAKHAPTSTTGSTEENTQCLSLIQTKSLCILLLSCHFSLSLYLSWGSILGVKATVSKFYWQISLLEWSNSATTLESWS